MQFFRVRGRRQGQAASRSAAGVLAALPDQTAALPGDGAGYVDQRGAARHERFQHRCEKDVMRAAEHDTIRARIQDGLQQTARRFHEIGIVQLQGFHLRRPARTRHDVDPHRAGVTPDQICQMLAARGRDGRQHGDAPAFRLRRRRFDARFDADHVDARQRFPQSVDRCRGGGVAGHHDLPASLFHEVLADAQRARADEGVVLVAIRNVRRIGKIGQIRMR